MYNNPGPRKPERPAQEGLEARFNALPAWGRFGLIGCNALFVIVMAVIFVSLLGEAVSVPTPATAQIATPVSSSQASPTSAPTLQSTHYPPTLVVDLFALAAKGDASVVHEFHSEGVGLATCPQPKREVTVDPSITGQQLAEDLLAYYYGQKLDNTCGALVLAYHDQGEAEGTYTAGRINLDVTDSSGAINVDQNATNLTHKLTLDIGGIGANQEYVVTY